MATLNVTEVQFEELILKEGFPLEEIFGKVAELDMDDVRKKITEDTKEK